MVLTVSLLYSIYDSCVCVTMVGVNVASTREKELQRRLKKENLSRLLWAPLESRYRCLHELFSMTIFLSVHYTGHLYTSGHDQSGTNVGKAQSKERTPRLKRCFRILLAISLA